MFYKLSLLLFFLVNSCVNYPSLETNKRLVKKKIFLNKGFTLVYSDELLSNKKVSKKIETRSLIIYQKNLKKNTIVKITNLINGKYLIATVGKNSNYPFFYNSVISKRIADELILNKEQPYVEIKEIIEGTSFFAKKAKTFDEEKNVATKAPIDSIEIDYLSKKAKKNKKNMLIKFNYIIKVGDFYFNQSAKDLQKRINDETNLKNVHILKISSTKFRVFLGPFKNLISLKKEFNVINNLQFDYLEIIKK